jgi:hypothetical protein
MKLVLVYTLLIFTLFSSYGQKQGNIWYFGDHAGLNFNNNPPTPLLNGQTLQFSEGCSSISDSSGSFLFYTNGIEIWNNQQQIMPNGDSLMGNVSSTQSSIIVPQPNSQEHFYVFTTDALEHQFQNGLRYSIVDMCLDNGKGDVISNSKNIPLVGTTSEKLICVRHSNGTDYWIITHKYNSDAFYSFKLTSSGIIDTVISHTGTPDSVGWGGQMVSYLNGQKIIYAMVTTFSYAKTLMLDFDASTGIVSNEQILSTGGCEWGIAISPDNSKLYTCSSCNGQLFQYDLNAGNLTAIITSKTFIAQNPYWRSFQLGPDNKIYISKTKAGNNGSDYITQIKNPNNLFPACNFTDSAIYLGGKNCALGLPNFIAGYNYSNTVVNCETGINEVGNKDISIKIYPNPAQQSFNIELPQQQNFSVVVFDVRGRKVVEIKNATGTIKVDCSSFSSGVYCVQAVNQRTVLTSKFIKE